MDFENFKELNYEIMKGKDIKESDCEEYENIKEQVSKAKWYVIGLGFDFYWKPKIFIEKETSSKQEAIQQTEMLQHKVK